MNNSISNPLTLDNMHSSSQYFNYKSKDFYSKYASHPAFKERYLIWNQYIDRYLISIQNHTVCLDIGCGPGILTELIARHNVSVVGIDQSNSMLKLAEEYTTQCGAEQLINYINASVPLPKEIELQYTNSVQMIICSSVLEYIWDWKEAIRQFYTLLKPGGILLISLPNRRSLYRGFERVLKKTPLSNNLYIKHQHHQFDPRDVDRLFVQANYSVLDKAFFALPFHRQLSWLMDSSRPEWLATMFLVVAQKNERL